MISRTIVFWCSILGLSLVLLFALSQVILPFVIGFILAYLLNPLVTKLETFNIPRPVSSILFIILMIIAIILLAIILYKPIANEINQFIQGFPALLSTVQERLETLNLDWLYDFTSNKTSDGDNPNVVNGIIEQLQLNFKEMTLGARTVLGRLYDGGLALVDVAMLLFISPIIAAYLLADWPKVVNTIRNNLPRDHQDELMKLWQQINNAISGFIRGQSTVCISLAAFYAIALTLVGLPFGIVIGLLTGLLSFIPFVGAVGGFLISMLVGLTAFWGEWLTLLNLIVVFIVGQVLESYVLTPKLIGDRVALHPVWLMFSLFSFGYLFGFIGLLVAVPISASIAVLIRYAFMQYRESHFYQRSLNLDTNQEEEQT